MSRDQIFTKSKKLGPETGNHLDSGQGLCVNTPSPSWTEFWSRRSLLYPGSAIIVLGKDLSLLTSAAMAVLAIAGLQQSLTEIENMTKNIPVIESYRRKRPRRVEKYLESIFLVKVLTKSDWVYCEWPASACLAAQPTAQAHLHALALVPCCARANPSSMPAKKNWASFFLLIFFFFFSPTLVVSQKLHTCIWLSLKACYF